MKKFKFKRKEKKKKTYFVLIDFLNGLNNANDEPIYYALSNNKFLVNGNKINNQILEIYGKEIKDYYHFLSITNRTKDLSDHVKSIIKERTETGEYKKYSEILFNYTSYIPIHNIKEIRFLGSFYL